MSPEQTTASEIPAISFTPIGKVISPYQEKFAIPRQPGLVPAAKGHIKLTGEPNNIDLTRGLEDFSHLWVIFIFHGTQDKGWHPLVRPPRLGGNKKTGVLSTRSTFRPNPIGLSVVKLDGITVENAAESNQQVRLNISELDLLNNTPILDIKPYIPYCDSIESAEAGFAQDQPAAEIEVFFDQLVLDFIATDKTIPPDFYSLVNQVLAQDPRPAYKKNKPDDKIYGMRLYHFNIQWQMISLKQCKVLKIQYD